MTQKSKGLPFNSQSSKNIKMLMFLILTSGIFFKMLMHSSTAVGMTLRDGKSQNSISLQDVQLQMRLFPLEHQLAANVDITWKSPQEVFTFALHSQLSLAPHKDYELTRLSKRGLAQTYQVKFHKPQVKTNLVYQGEINEPIREGESPGIITDKGVSLLSESYWHPSFKENAPWTVEVELPDAEWKVMMPGVMTELEGNRYRFESYLPTQEWALVADRFHIFKVTTPAGKLIQVWLKEDQATLAQSYLDLVPGYIENYSKILGPFPFSGYTVIENSLETGYAFPGFTLLGPSVIRLPFLLRSSLPHEILHSWWGNSVLVDYERGNWCEGLTTYMADRAYAIEDGKGPEYRRASLQNFQDFVTKDRDFPLRRFISRNDRGTQSVGYGKSMMLFQMLENHLGSSVFYAALSQFFHQNLWKSVGFAELQESFEKYTQQSLDSFFSPWLDQMGAPKLSITDLEVMPGASLRLSLKQEKWSGERSYVLPVRVRVLYEGGVIQNLLFNFEQSEQSFVIPQPPEVDAEASPQKLWVDPEFEVFRTLYSEETPFAMSQILVDKEVVTVSLPAAEKELYQAWIQPIQGLYSKNLRVITDQEALPEAGPLWIVGSNNLHAKVLSRAIADRQINIVENQMSYDSKIWNLKRSTVFLGESLQNRPVVLVWADKDQSASVLIQKIKHYTSFSIVGFTDQKNDFKQTWPVLISPLIRTF